MIPLCQAEGIGVIPWSPLARGMLAGTRTSLDDRQSTPRAEADTYAHELYKDPSGWDIVTAVQSVAEERGVSAAEVALAWLLSKPAVAAPIVGATKLSHLDAAVRAVGLELDPEEIERLEAPYRPQDVQGHS